MMYPLLFGMLWPSSQTPSFTASDMFRTPDATIVALPARLACEPEVSQYAWSRDGQYLLAVRSDRGLSADLVRASSETRGDAKPVPTHEIVLWRSGSGVSTRVLKWSGSEQSVDQIEFMGATGSALVTISNAKVDESTILLVAPSGAYRTLAKDSLLRAQASPTEPIAVIQTDKEARMVGTDGTLLQQASIPARTWLEGWSRDGRTAKFVEFIRDAPNQPSRRRYYDFGVRGWRVSAEAPSAETNQNPDEWISTRVMASPRNESAVFVRLGPDADAGRSMSLGVNLDQVEVSPNRSAVSYVSSGALFVRTLVKADIALYQSAEDAAERASLISDVKQIGIGFAIFLADNDDLMPDAKGWEDQIYPYIKNRDLMAGFQYTFRGRSAAVENPSTTEMGFKRGKGGRAVVYMDTSVRWVPDP